MPSGWRRISNEMITKHHKNKPASTLRGMKNGKRINGKRKGKAGQNNQREIKFDP